MNTEAFKALRIKQGLRQEDIANHLGISLEAVSRWESGASCPRAELLPKIAKLLNCKIDRLF